MIGIVAALALVTLILTAFGSNSPAPVATTTTAVAASRCASGARRAGNGGQPPDQASGRGRRGHGCRLPRRGSWRRGVEPGRPPAQRGAPCTPVAPDRRIGPGRPRVDSARRRHGNGCDGRRGGAGNRRLLAGRGNRRVDLRFRDRRQAVRVANRRAAERCPVVDRLPQPRRAGPALTVGSPVLASSSKLGTVVDVAAVERQSLAKHAGARGNNVAIEVHPAAGSLP